VIGPGSRGPAAAAAALCLLAGCASAPTTASTAPACQGLVPPRFVAAAPVPLPPTYLSAHIASNVLEEIVVERDGAVRRTRFLAATVPELAPFAQISLEKTRYVPAAIQGNPVAIRGVVTIPIGVVPRTPASWKYDLLRAFVPGGVSREAQWQLAGSVDRLTLVAHVGNAVPQGASIVAVGPDGAEKVLFAIAAGEPPLEIREIVKTGAFFQREGDYRIEVRAPGAPVRATTTLTIAAGFESSVVNACEPLDGPEKAGPGH
jgi:hypothetical protein